MLPIFIIDSPRISRGNIPYFSVQIFIASSPIMVFKMANCISLLLPTVNIMHHYIIWIILKR